MTTIVLKKKDIEQDVSEFSPGDEACFKVYTTVKDISDDSITLEIDSVVVKSHNDEEYDNEDDSEDDGGDEGDSEHKDSKMEKPSEGRVVAVLIGKHR